MTYNTRVFVGLAAIVLMAVVFAQPSVASQPTETYTSVSGLYDMTQLSPYDGLGMTSMLTNPGFEANVVSTGDGTGLLETYAGWSHNSGSTGSYTWNPSGTNLYGATGNVMPAPYFPGTTSTTTPYNTASATPPHGFTVDSSGSQVLATWKDAFIAQTVHSFANTASNYTTTAHQTYVMTWEYGCPTTIGSASGVSVGIFYSGSSNFFLCNDDTCYDNGHTDGGYGQQTGFMYQYAWSFATDSCTKNFVGKTLTIRLGGGTTGGTGYNYFDNIHLYGPVPEPSTVALLVTGALGMLAYAWRRKRRK